MKLMIFQFTFCFQNSELTLQSTANVTVNARSEYGNITGQLFIGNDEVVARNQKLYIKTDQGKDILYADKDKILFASDKLEFSSKVHVFLFIPLRHRSYIDYATFAVSKRRSEKISGLYECSTGITEFKGSNTIQA